MLAQGETDPNETAAVNIGKNWQGSTFVAIPYEVDEKGNQKWRIEFPQDQGKAGELFKLWHQSNIQSKIRGLGITDRALTQEDVGSHAIGKEHGDTFKESLRVEAEWFIDNVNRYILPVVTMMNFGPEAPVPEIGMSAMDPKRMDLTAEIIRERVKQGNFTTDGMELDMERVAEIWNIPMKRIEESKEAVHQNNAPQVKGKEVGQIPGMKADLATVDKTETLTKKEVEDAKSAFFKANEKASLDRIKALNATEKPHIEKMTDISVDQNDKIVKSLETELNGDYSLASIKKMKIPMMGKMKDALKSMMFDTYEAGLKSAKDELNLKGMSDEAVPAERKWINMTVDNTAFNMEHFIRSQINRAVIDDPDKSNPKDVVLRVSMKLKENVNARIKQIVRNHGVQMFNRARVWTAEQIA